jgi:O-antigen/teichoic acid export membrane protein
MSLSLNSNKSLPDDENRHFRTDHLKADLGGRTARGGVVTIASQGFKFFTGMAGTVVLARLLTPQDYGLIGMVAVIMGFVSMFKDMGLSVATIQKEEITGEQVSTLFWVNLGLSLVVMALTVAIAPGVAWFYGEPRLTLITIGFAAGFLFSGLTVQHEALLRRQMRFVALAAIEIISLIVGLIVAITLAWRGWGYWALVVNQLAQGLTYAVGVWAVCSWRPGRFVRGADVRSMLAFGGNLTGFHVVNFFARNLDNMLIGLVWGSRPLGLYAKAYQLLLLPIDQINEPIASVAVPALSRLSDAPERYRKAYLRILEKLAMLTMPGMALMIATSDWIVTIVLGAQWIEASRIFALLGVAGLVQPVANTTGWLFITQNRTRHMFQWGIIGSLIIVASIVGGLPWGAVGVAASYSVVFVCVVMPLLLWFVGREGPVRTVDLYKTIAPSLCAALAVLGALALFRWRVGVSRPIYGVAASFGITVIISLIIFAILPRGRKALQDLKHSYVLLIRKQKTVQEQEADIAV